MKKSQEMKSPSERLRVVAIFALSLLGSVAMITTFAIGACLQNSAVGFAALILGSPCHFVVVYCMLNLCVFRFNYSCFGPWKRTPFPRHWPQAPLYWTSLRIGKHFRCSTALAGVWCFREGLGLSPLPLDRVFIPIEQIQEVALNGKTLTVHHASSELRDPIRISLVRTSWVNNAWSAEDQENAVEAFLIAFRKTRRETSSKPGGP